MRLFLDKDLDFFIEDCRFRIKHIKGIDFMDDVTYLPFTYDFTCIGSVIPKNKIEELTTYIKSFDIPDFTTGEELDKQIKKIINDNPELFL